jgi:hydroxymethylpyrimidine/phosphomethylpyrimidine kinase
MQRADAPVTPPVVLSIAGSDSGGGAGIQADLKTIEAGGGFGTTAVTSVTAQNTTGVHGTHLLPTEEIAAQIRAVREDFDVAAVKTGMLATSEIIDLVAERAPALPNLVVDPVMVAASGDRLLEPEAEDAYERLIAEAALVTPNADEAAVLTGQTIADPDAAADAGRDLVEMGADAALVKGGHVPGDEVVDVLVTPDAVTTIRHDRIDTEATHGSGCTLSSAIATRLAHGDSMRAAVADGIDLLARAVRYNIDVGEGPGAVHHLVETRNDASRNETSEAVEAVVSALVDRDVAPLVPDSGLNVAGATPSAEHPEDIAAVEGGIARVVGGVRANRGVRFGVTSRPGRALLAVRERDPDRRFAVDCRPTVDEGLDALDGAVGQFDPNERVGADAVQVDDSDQRIVALLDRGVEGRVVLLSDDPTTLVERIETVLARIDG